MAGIVSGTEFGDWTFDALKQWVVERETSEDADKNFPHLRRVIAFDVSSRYDNVVKVSAGISIEVDDACEAIDVAKKLFIATHADASDPKISAQEIGVRYEYDDDSARDTVVVSLDGFFSADKGEEKK